MDPVATERRPLGRTGIAVSRIGAAAFSFTGRGGGVPERGGLSATDVERAYHELGVNTFLVIPGITPALNEGARRLIRAGHRDDLVLISEASAFLAGGMSRKLHRYLRSVGTTCLDVWLYGWVRGRRQLRPAVWSEMQALQTAGATRAIGFSAHDRRLAAALNAELSPDVLMLRYNASHRGAEREVFAGLDPDPGRRPGVVAYTATRWGMLLRPLPAAGFGEGMSGPDCYRFALGHPCVDMAWCAARTFEELEADVAGAAAGPLSAERLREVCRFGDAVHAGSRGGRRWMFGNRAD